MIEVISFHAFVVQGTIKYSLLLLQVALLLSTYKTMKLKKVVFLQWNEIGRWHLLGLIHYLFRVSEGIN